MKQNHQSLALWIEKLKSRPDDVVIQFKRHGEWIERKSNDYLKIIVHFQNILKEQGFKKKSHVALLSQTRWEWAAFDVAVLCGGGLLIPLYPNMTDEDITYILNHSEADIFIVENAKQEQIFERIKNQMQKKIQIIVMDKMDYDFTAIQEHEIDQMIQSAHEVKPTDPITIIYTSGTTGQPKGVLMQEQALVSEVAEAFSLFEINNSDQSLSFLPYAHVMGRIEHWGGLFTGCRIAFAESIDLLRKNLQEIKPTIMIAVPRIFEKIYSGILTQVETSPIKKNLFQQALSVAEKMDYYRKTHQVAPLHILLQYEVLSKIVFAPVKKAFGGRLRFAISGGAPLSKDLGQFFSYMGIKALEGYGLTETFAAITVNTETQWELGTVGKPIGDVEIKFAEDGEILVRSKKCLKEYYKNPEATQSAIDADGFFATGDIGEFNDQGYLKITDRKKDLIKTAGGKYVAPQKLEGLLKQEPLVAQVFIYGDQRRFISALITIEQPMNNDDDIKRAHDKIQQHVVKTNSVLASYESIKKFEVIFETWSTDNGCLTPSLKVKRKVIEKKYFSILDSFYK